MNTVISILRTVEPEQKSYYENKPCPFCREGSPCDNEFHNTHILPNVYIIQLLPSEVVEWLKEPTVIRYNEKERGVKFPCKLPISNDNSPVNIIAIVIDNERKMLLGAGIVKETQPNCFHLTNVIKCIPAIIPAHFIGKRIESEVLIISYLVVEQAQPYMLVSAEKSDICQFRDYIVEQLYHSATGDLSTLPDSDSDSDSESTITIASVDSKMEAEAERFMNEIEECKKPLYLYVNVRSVWNFPVKQHLTIKESGEVILNLNSSTTRVHYRNIIEYLTSIKDILDIKPEVAITSDIALKEVNVALGDYKETSLHYLIHKMPGVLDQIGIAYSEEQEKCRQKLKYLGPGCKFIVRGCPESPAYLEANGLFRCKDTSSLTPNDVMRLVLGHGYSIPEVAFNFLFLDMEDMLGHNRTLSHLVHHFTQQQQQFVGYINEDKYHREELLRLLKNWQEATYDDEKTDMSIHLLQYMTSYCEEYLHKYESLKKDMVEKCYDWIINAKEDSCLLVDLSKMFLRICKEPKVDIVREKEMYTNLVLLEDITQKVCERMPPLADIQNEICMLWKVRMRTMKRGTAELEEMVRSNMTWLQKYIAVLQIGTADDWSKYIKHFSITHRSMEVLNLKCKTLQKIVKLGPTFTPLTKIEEICKAIHLWTEENGFDKTERSKGNEEETWLILYNFITYTGALVMLMS
jgi:hypothetical protein